MMKHLTTIIVILLSIPIIGGCQTKPTDNKGARSLVSSTPCEMEDARLRAEIERLKREVEAAKQQAETERLARLEAQKNWMSPA
jgi:50S ribosomal subunit-associated GTPase HflX